MEEKQEWQASLDRKLTAEETANLKDALRPILLANKAEEEYIGDVTEYCCSMVSNQKSINYVAKELIEMEFDFLPALVVEEIADKIQQFMALLSSSSSNANAGNAAAAAAAAGDEEADEQNVKSRLVSIKSSAKNALTMSGALGASRKGGQSKQQQEQQDSQQKKQQNKKEAKGGKQKDDDKHRRDNNPRGRRNNNDEPRHDGRGGRRDRHGRAFDRLTDRQHEGRRGPENHRGPRGGGGRGGDGPLGRRGDRGRDDRGRGGRGGGGPRGGRVSGNRRDREEFQQEDDFVPADDPRGRGRRGGGRDDRGSRGRGFDPNKRQRMEEGRGGGRGDAYYDEYQEYEGGYDDYDYSYDYYPSPRGAPPRGGGRWGGRFRGRGFRGRGGGRFGGRARGRGDFGPPSEEGQDGQDVGTREGSENNEATEMAAGHPSPIVQANYGGGFRGRGFRGRGRGRSFPGRAHVQNILASKSWVRKKDGEGGDDAQGGQSSEALQDGGEG